MTTKGESSRSSADQTTPRQVLRSADTPTPAHDVDQSDTAATQSTAATTVARQWQRARPGTSVGVHRLGKAVSNADPATRRRWEQAALATGAALPVAVTVAAVVRHRRRRPRNLLRRLANAIASR